MSVGDAHCVSWLSHTSTNTTFLSKATNNFSHMLLQRCEAKMNDGNTGIRRILVLVYGGNIVLVLVYEEC